MSKVIVVDDKLLRIQKILLSIQASLIVAWKRGIMNELTPVEVILLHVLDNSDENEQDRFDKIKAVLLNRKTQMEQGEQSGQPFDLEYSYQSIRIDKEKYPLNMGDCKNAVIEKIDQLRNNETDPIILDVILAEGKDMNTILKEAVLSNYIYLNYRKSCIPYTHFDEDGVKFRQIWEKRASLEACIIARDLLNPQTINRDFCKRLWKIMGIVDGEDNDRL